ncbi:MAG: bifunctional 4-hydroxy-3-methylbut-2-enyl diphosphate reductase/30S ribosomal protein S1 [Clostridia bacterium]
MQVNLAKTAGFCFGVDRAVELLYNLLNQGKKVCTLGPIIHNPQVIDELTKKGVVIANEPSEVPLASTLVIRAHGVTRQVIEELDALGIKYEDATCPFVTKIHDIIKKNSTEQNVVLIAGDEKHPEVCGFRSHCKGESFVFNNCEEMLEIVQNNPCFMDKQLIFVAQTTFSVKEKEKCVKNLQKLYTNVLIFGTICKATSQRQNEAKILSESCDAMVVVGGRFSSNTVKLKNVCEENCKTFLVETAQELKKFDFSECDNIGVTAGASTPAGIIKEVLFTMSEILNDQTNSEEMSFEAALEENLKKMSSDQKVLGVVVGIAPNEIQVDIGRKYAGFIPSSEYSNDPTADPSKELKIGDEINVIIMRTNDAEGTMMLSKRRFDAIAAWDDIIAAKEADEVLEGVVAEAVKGGVLVYAKGIRVFIPGSLTGLPRDAELSTMLKETVKFRIIDVDKSKRRVVGSIQAVLKEARAEITNAFWETVAEGQEFTGVVKSLTSYGAFVDLGGVDGMVHISELSWKRIKNPAEIVNVGDTVSVFVKSLDHEKRKISLGYKRIEDNPWEILSRDYQVGDVIDSTIAGLTTFGAFSSVIDGIDGLIHISQIADRHIASPKEVLKVGEQVQVMITEIDFDKKRVSLSIRALLENQDADTEEYVAEEAAE